MESELVRLTEKLAKATARVASLRTAITRALNAQRLRDALTYAKEQGVELPVTWETEFSALHGWVGKVQTLQRKLHRARQRVEILEKEVVAMQKKAPPVTGWPEGVYNPRVLIVSDDCYESLPCKHPVRYVDSDGYPRSELWGAVKICDWHVSRGVNVPKHFTE